MLEKLAVCMIGSYRDFFKNGDNFGRFLEFIIGRKDVVFFAYISKVSEYQRWHNSLFSKMNYKYYRGENEMNEDLFLEKMSEYGISYVLEYYNSCEDIVITKADGINNELYYKGRKGIVNKTDTFLYQMVLEKRCSGLLKKYEEEKGVYFDRVMKIRPDLYFNENFFCDEILESNIFIRNMDLFYICPRWIYDKLLLKIDYLDFRGYDGNKHTVYGKVKDKIKEMDLKYDSNMDLNHDLSKVLMDILGIENKSVWNCLLVRAVFS